MPRALRHRDPADPSRLVAAARSGRAVTDQCGSCCTPDGGLCPGNSCCTGSTPCAFNLDLPYAPAAGIADATIQYGAYVLAPSSAGSAPPYQSDCLRVGMDNERIISGPFGPYGRVAYQSFYDGAAGTLTVRVTATLNRVPGDGGVLVEARMLVRVDMARNARPCPRVLESRYIFDDGASERPMNFNALTIEATNGGFGGCVSRLTIRWYDTGTVNGAFFYSQGGITLDYRTACYCGTLPVFDECPGRCCLPGGGCVENTLSECASQGGIWIPGYDCALPCPSSEPRGACCHPGGCTNDLTAAECDALNGTLFVGQLCSEVSCLGACCLPDGSCTPMLSLLCVAAGGVFHGVGVECAQTECIPIPGCCSGQNQSCFIYDPGFGWTWDASIRLQARLYRNAPPCQFVLAADQTETASGSGIGAVCQPASDPGAAVTVFGDPGTSADNMTAVASLVIYDPGGPPTPYLRLVVSGGGVPAQTKIIPADCDGVVFNEAFNDRGSCTGTNPATSWQWRNIEVSGSIAIPTGRRCNGQAGRAALVVPRGRGGGGCLGCGAGQRRSRA